MKFEIGAGVPCELDVLQETRLLVTANSGFGKSHTLRRILEQTHGHVQQLVIDTEGEFYTLRQKYDYVLVAKEGGEAAADPRIVPLLTRRLLELGASAILDISELKPHERIAFVQRFAETLVDVPRSLWRDTLIVFDEAQIFCPQSGKAESLGPINDLMGRARKRGFCPILATLRLSMLHKDSANLCTNKLIGQGMEADARRAADELGFPGREGWQKIRDLDRGDFYAFGPAISKVVTKVHIGPTVTEAPRRGMARAAPPPLPKSVEALLPQLSDLPAEVEQERKDNADLRRDLANARRELTVAQKTQASPDKAVLQRRVDQAVVTAQREHAVALREASGYADRLERHMKDAAGKFIALGTKMLAAVNGARPAITPTPLSSAPSRPEPTPPAARPSAREPVSRRPDSAPDGMTRSQQRILDVLSGLEAIGVEEPHKNVVAVFAGVSPTSGGYFNNLGALRTQGLATYPRAGAVALTETGRSVAAPPETPATLAGLHDAWCAVLTASQATILRALIELYPEPIEKGELAAQIGVSPTSGGYFNNLGRLRTLGAAAYPQAGSVAATVLLFPEHLA